MPRGVIARARRSVVVLWAMGLTLLICAPLLPPGYALSYDMVFVPNQSLVPAAWGVGSPPPRAVPADALIAVLDEVVAGQVIQKVLLLLVVFLAAVGASRLVPTESVLVRFIAAGIYAWNPYVAERLVIGHWALLLAYAFLPWVARVALDVRAGRSGSVAKCVLLLAGSSLAPSGGLLAAIVALVLVSWPTPVPLRRRAPAVVSVWAAAVVVNAPWWVPAVLGTARGAEPGGFAEFAARGEGGVGVLPTLLGLGGIWNADVVLESRVGVVVVITALLALAGVGFGWSLLRTRWPHDDATALLALGVGGMVLALLGATPWIEDMLSTWASQLPALGLFRDGHKFIGLAALPLAVLCPLAIERLVSLSWVRPGGRAVLVVAALLPFAVLPDLAWGATGRLSPVTYPADWAQVRLALAADPQSGDVVALPWSAFRRFAWNDDRTQLDPATRYLDRTVVVDDRLLVGDEVVPGEDPRAGRVEALLESGRPAAETLPGEGISWVLVERGTPGAADLRVLLAGAQSVVEGQELDLYRLPGANPPGTAAAAPWVAAVDALAVLCVLWACWSSVRTMRRQPALLVSTESATE